MIYFITAIPILVLIFLLLYDLKNDLKKNKSIDCDSININNQVYGPINIFGRYYCAICGKPMKYMDPHWPYHCEINRCEEHKNDKLEWSINK